MRVPREWVDLRSWAAHYYLGVELNLEQCWMRVYGYATHQQLRHEGRYDRMDETYSLEVEELIEDPSVMWTAIELSTPSRLEVEAMPKLSRHEAEALLKILSQSAPYSPRLDVPFAQWGALMADEKFRNALYQRLQRNAIPKGITTNLIPKRITTKLTTNLGQWFQQSFEAGWQSLDTLLNTESANLAYSSYALRQRQLEVGAFEGVKVIDLGMELGNQSVALLIGLTPEAEQKVAIRVQLHPVGGHTYLPAKIKLALLSRSGKVLQEIQARTQDNFIQLKRFTTPRGKNFSIRVALDDFSITENLALEN